MDDARFSSSIITALQLHTQPPFVHSVADIVALAINRLRGEDPPPSHPAATQIAADGYAPLGQILSPSDCAAICDHFKARRCYNAHTVPSFEHERAALTPASFEDAERSFHFGTYPLGDILEAPKLWELANRPEILAIAAAYLGCLPTIYSLNAWWSFPAQTKAPVTQNFHRDFDDFRFCTLFVYLTDVSATTGPHRFIRQSHRFDRIRELVQSRASQLGPRASELRPEHFYGNTQAEENDRLYEAVFAGLIDSIAAPAGFAFLADTSALHMGIPPTSAPRLMFWARYGLRSNHTAVSPVPAPARIKPHLEDPVTADINRCLVSAP